MTPGECREKLQDLVQRMQALGGTFDLDGLRHEIDRLSNLSASEGFWDDQKRAQKLMRERASAEEILKEFERVDSETNDLLELLDLAASEGDEGVVADVAGQLPAIEAQVRTLELKRMLSKDDDTDAIVTINPGAGGTEAQDWADILLRMYLRWCERRGFKTELLSKQPGDEAGIKDASFIARGANAYGYLRAENGVHRLIRISPFDANKRRHTSFAGVSVVPDLGDELSEGEIEIRDEDLDVSTMRSGGAGGQHVNRTESAVRMKHIPTGFTVRCEAERSQHQNRDTALKMLRGLLFEKARREREEAFEEAFLNDRADIAFGSQVRTYTLQPYTMVKDERTDHKVTNADAVLDGDLDEFIETYLLMNAEKKKKKAGDARDE
ncbi:MAG: peptide chain release factor 2 [Deltaproteobacteria bacterium]|nr:peptide chain release factor 2 [Deltaproteobacteria bacterium]MBT8465602.1 peptide chain release factor 2 [Deltaproteobacteria bacterium]NND27553.1 peptide chain release factor 2 [Myxococcales bacterium]NNK09618.1 peptide chain release factor 2 [Myxococcales bacterium]NNK44392.1 peptide chain release factor 2 [Myxococcales bacterium]